MTNNEHPLIPNVRAALHQVYDPEMHKPITDLGMVDNIEANDQGQVIVRILLTVAGCPMKNELATLVREAIEKVTGVTQVTIELGVMDDEQRAALRQLLQGGRPVREIPFSKPGNLTRVIAIASGKGGVGKSSVSVNLAIALQNLGKNVGILDADIYGHSVPDMLGISDRRPTVVDDMILPVPMKDLKVISIGMLKSNRDQIVAWRGPILDRALTQLLADVFWGDLDFLLIDLPPGTGDVAISLGQKIPGSEVIVVTTPQPTAADVAERAGTMAHMMHQKVLGVIENMSWLESACPNCGQTHIEEIFGTGGGAEVALRLTDRLGYEIPLMAQIPFDNALRTGNDNGEPIVCLHSDHPSAKAIISLAKSIATTPKGLVGQQLPIV